jgi:hypothetical protein
MTAASVFTRLAPAALVVGLLGGSIGGLIGAAASASAGESAEVEKALAAVKAAHDKYQDPKVAVAAGFLPTDSCVTHESMGTMGFHYVHPKLIAAPVVQNSPAILVYQPDGDGGRKLVAVEWFQPDADQDLTTSDDKPSLFSRAFDGPMEGHEPGMPRHYDQHAWLWQDNPKGALEPYNPAGSCKGAETIVTVPAAAPAHAGMDMDDPDTDGTDEDAETDGGQVTHKPAGGADAGGGAVDSDQMVLVGLGVAVAAAGLGLGAAGRSTRRRT